jgi:hypothetical protein
MTRGMTPRRVASSIRVMKASPVEIQSDRGGSVHNVGGERWRRAMVVAAMVEVACGSRCVDV